MPGMPLESLVQLGGTQDVDPSVDVTCCTGDFIIVNNLTNSKALPFCAGQVMDVDDNSAIVQWWHPSMSKEANLKAGRKRNILDLFGEWSPADELAVGLTAISSGPFEDFAAGIRTGGGHFTSFQSPGPNHGFGLRRSDRA